MCTHFTTRMWMNQIYRRTLQRTKMIKHNLQCKESINWPCSFQVSRIYFDYIIVPLIRNQHYDFDFKSINSPFVCSDLLSIPTYGLQLFNPYDMLEKVVAIRIRCMRKAFSRHSDHDEIILFPIIFRMFAVLFKRNKDF